MPNKPTPADLARQAAALAKLKAGCKKAKTGPVSFFFCSKGPDGDPVLLVGKRIQAEAKGVVAKAKEKKFVRGKLVYQDKTYTFQADKPKSSKFQKLLKSHFGKEFAPLKSAQIVPIPQDGAPEGDEAVAMKDELAAAVARRRSRQAEQSDDREGYWAARLEEAEADLGAKLDIVEGAEAAISARLAGGSTEKVAARLEKTLKRVGVLLQSCEGNLMDVRSDEGEPTDSREEYREWMVDLQHELEALQDRLEHLGRKLERMSQPAADLSVLLTRHGKMMTRLAGLGELGDAEVWLRTADTAQRRLGRWVREHARQDPDDEEGLRHGMVDRRKVIRRSRALVETLPSLDEELARLTRHIDAQHSVADPRSGLAALASTGSALRQLGLQVEESRAGLRSMTRRAGDPPLFAGLLGQTARLRAQARKAEDALDRTLSSLEAAVEDLSVRKAQAGVRTHIDRELGQLPHKNDPESWLKEHDLLLGLLDEWSDHNGALNTPSDAGFIDEARAVLHKGRALVTSTADHPGQVKALSQARKALSGGDADGARALRLRAEALIDELVSGEEALRQLSVAFSGPPIFQGIAAGLAAAEGELKSDLYAIEAAEREAVRAALAELEESELREALASQLAALRSGPIAQLREASLPEPWLLVASRARRALVSWEELGADLDPVIDGYREVEKVLSAVQGAQGLLPSLQSADLEFERRRTIEFARASADADEAVVLRVAMERLQGRMERDLTTLEGLSQRALAAGKDWDIFPALVARTRERIADLADLVDRLYRMHYDQEEGDPDEKTTSQGGQIDLTPEEEAAVKQLVERRLASFVEEENRDRTRRGEPLIDEDAVPEEVTERFRRIARRMVKERTSRYG